ncbi:hypothetical protein MKA27_13130 [[Clostridium] innocuum]|uniref:5' nucleotidase, NT5C type n=1 Tax=Clostridium innocuum TaxID=1522 RepID=UPI000D78DE03|nr:hypothetical protein [[Clostridium] innocuum]MCR0315251.1 hypothetical protein [[Clostridium] innocuum]MCR0369727.1 hypothetical protein [[Clostridium] innocuum]MCR0374762.1 hypothetical protein [[Clostridium] innocuum]MCR0559680.1 hypothetical protein [[Clostridium] innocuum]MCR0602626.1 hypothetical protein [[Clostridium] innocuum]
MKTWKSGGNRPRILFDMDDVVTNFMEHLLNIYNKRTKSDLKVTDIKGWDLTPYCTKDVYKIFQEDGFFLNIPEKKHSTSVLKELIESTKYDIYIVTACNRPEELSEKVKWFKKILPAFNTDRIIAIKEKHLIRGDLIIDDKVENLIECEPYMKCLLYDTPANQYDEKFKRIRNLSELPGILENLFYPEA